MPYTGYRAEARPFPVSSEHLITPYNLITLTRSLMNWGKLSKSWWRKRQDGSEGPETWLEFSQVPWAPWNSLTNLYKEIGSSTKLSPFTQVPWHLNVSPTHTQFFSWRQFLHTAYFDHAFLTLQFLPDPASSLPSQLHPLSFSLSSENRQTKETNRTTNQRTNINIKT